jgi:hypothetical protein
MSLDSFYDYILSDSLVSEIVYWLAVPWLVLVWVLQGHKSEMSFDAIFADYVRDYEGRLRR